MYNIRQPCILLLLLLRIPFFFFFCFHFSRNTNTAFSYHFQRASHLLPLMHSSEVWLFDIMGDLASFNVENIVLKSKYTKRNDRENKWIRIHEWSECTQFACKNTYSTHTKTYAMCCRDSRSKTIIFINCSNINSIIDFHANRICVGE